VGQAGRASQAGNTYPTYLTDRTYQTERIGLYRATGAYLNGFFAGMHEYRRSPAVALHDLSITQ
jgi:hypothetical protein